MSQEELTITEKRTKKKATKSTLCTRLVTQKLQGEKSHLSKVREVIGAKSSFSTCGFSLPRGLSIANGSLEKREKTGKKANKLRLERQGSGEKIEKGIEERKET